MSSKKLLWVVVVSVIILLGLWYAGVFKSFAPSTTQPAAVTTAVTSNTAATNATAAQDLAIKSDVTALDAQVTSINTAMSVSGTPTKAQISAVAANFKTVTALYGKLIVELNARTTNKQTAGGSVAGVAAAMNDLSVQLSNMSSQAGVAAINVMATSSNSTTITASFKQLKTAQTYAAAARADLGTILQTLGIK